VINKCGTAPKKQDNKSHDEPLRFPLGIAECNYFVGWSSAGDVFMYSVKSGTSSFIQYLANSAIKERFICTMKLAQIFFQSYNTTINSFCFLVYLFIDVFQFPGQIRVCNLPRNSLASNQKLISSTMRSFCMNNKRSLRSRSLWHQHSVPGSERN